MDRFEFEKRIFVALIERRNGAQAGTEDERRALAREAFAWARAFTDAASELHTVASPFAGFGADDAEPG